jgi:hypothetical protein
MGANAEPAQLIDPHGIAIEHGRQGGQPFELALLGAAGDGLPVERRVSGGSPEASEARAPSPFRSVQRCGMSRANQVDAPLNQMSSDTLLRSAPAER